MTHDGLVEALRAIDGLVDVGQDPPIFHFRSKPFLHFHEGEDGVYADVRLGSGGFEPVPAATPDERLALLATVADHIDRIEGPRKPDRGRPRGRRR